MISHRQPRRAVSLVVAGPILVGLLVVSVAGCSGGYEAQTRSFREAVTANDFATAQVHIDTLVAEAANEGSGVESEYPLLLLERSTVAMAVGDFDSATRDLNEADSLLEILDLSSKGAGEEVGQYLWSDDVGLYRPPMYEKLMVNMVKLAAYLALGNYSAARVEARRINVLASYYDHSELAGHPVLATGYQLAGLAMELSGENDQAMRFYFDAWSREPTLSVARAIVGLVQSSSLGRRTEVQEARQALGMEETVDAPAAEQEVVVLVFSGLAPRREAERFPIGLVWGWVTSAGLMLSPVYQGDFMRLRAEQALTWVNFPVLVTQPQAYNHFDVRVGERGGVADEVADLEGFAIAQWEEERPTIALAALTRAIVRVLAREAIQAVGSAVSGSEGAQAAFFIASLLVQGGMQAADVPDTRTWTTMPGHVWLARLPAQPGPQIVDVRASGPGGSFVQQFSVDVPPGGTRVLALRVIP